MTWDVPSDISITTMYFYCTRHPNLGGSGEITIMDSGPGSGGSSLLSLTMGKGTLDPGDSQLALQLSDGSNVYNVTTISPNQGSDLNNITYLMTKEPNTCDINIYFDNVTETTADLMIKVNNSNLVDLYLTQLYLVISRMVVY